MMYGFGKERVRTEKIEFRVGNSFLFGTDVLYYLR